MIRTEVYQLIKNKVGLNEDEEYQKIYDPNNVWGESVHPLAVRNFKRFIAILYYLIHDKKNEFDLILGPGDAGIWMSKVTEMVYQKLHLRPPIILSLPIVRFKFTYLKYEGQPLELFDNSILVPEVKERIENLVKLENILFVDDEIKNGVTAKEAVGVVLKSVDKKKVKTPLFLTVIAEDQNFETENYLENIKTDIYPFALETKDMHGIVNYIVPWEIERQIKDLFSESEAGAKVRINMLLDLPSKEKELKQNLYIPKPIFIYDYNKKAQRKIPNFLQLQIQFRTKLNQWIDQAIEEYKNN